VIRSSRRGVVPRRILIAAAAALVPVIAGCEAGNNPPTLQWHQPTDGTVAYAGIGNSITISNVFVLGAPVGAVVPHGQNAGLFLGLVNSGPADRLIAIKAPGIAQSVQLPTGGIELGSRSRVLLTGPKPVVVLRQLVKPLAGGTIITIHLIFQKAGSKTLPVPVMPRVSNYSTFSPPPASSPSPLGAASHSAKAANGKHASASPSPTGSP
jgi:copper(I)-binding protein